MLTSLHTIMFNWCSRFLRYFVCYCYRLL